MSKEDFRKHYKAVSEYVLSSTLYELNEDGSMTDHAIITNEDFENRYWAIVRVDDDGWYEDTVEDDFDNAEEVLKRYKELEKELCE